MYTHKKMRNSVASFKRTINYAFNKIYFILFLLLFLIIGVLFYEFKTLVPLGFTLKILASKSYFYYKTTLVAKKSLLTDC